MEAPQETLKAVIKEISLDRAAGENLSPVLPAGAHITSTTKH